MVSIVAFQAVDPSSILGHRRLFSQESEINAFLWKEILYLPSEGGPGLLECTRSSFYRPVNVR